MSSLQLTKKIGTSSEFFSTDLPVYFTMGMLRWRQPKLVIGWLSGHRDTCGGTCNTDSKLCWGIEDSSRRSEVK